MQQGERDNIRRSSHTNKKHANKEIWDARDRERERDLKKQEKTGYLNLKSDKIIYIYISISLSLSSSLSIYVPFD